MNGVRIDEWVGLGGSLLQDGERWPHEPRGLGRIEFNKRPVKPAREIRVGDMLQIRTEGGDYHVEVLVLSEIRGPAAVAQTLYRETDSSRETRLKAAEERKALKNFTPAPEGRPSKRDRRKIIQFREERER